MSGESRAAVLGKPVSHSLSPVLHSAAYAALGLTGWTYERIEVDAAGLPALVAGLGPEWAGLSITMPGKHAALAVAAEATERATVVGAANTLVPLGDGAWRADCTDVDGVVGSLHAVGGIDAGGPAVVIGAGGTSAAAVVALVELGVSELRLVVREPDRARQTAEVAKAVGIDATVLRWSEVDWDEQGRQAAVVVSTVPSEAVEPHADSLAEAACVLDVIYHPWPTPLAKAVIGRGGRLATGLDMLLHQAFGQVEQFTGREAPRHAMRDALAAATGRDVGGH